MIAIGLHACGVTSVHLMRYGMRNGVELRSSLRSPAAQTMN